MSERAARIRLQLNNGSLLAGLGQIGDTVDHLGHRMTKALDRPVREGLSAMRSSLASLKGELSSAAGMAVTFGGAFTLGSAVKDALDLEQGYRNIAFAIRAGKGEAMDWQTVQQTVESTADRTSRTNGELSASFKALYDDIGDVGFASKAIETIGTIATGSGESIGTLTNLAGQLNEKFGVTASEVDDAMAAVIAMGNKGGISLADMGEKIGMIGASAKLMGLEGKQGVQFALGMFNIADAATGSTKKATAAVTQLMDQFSNTDGLKKIEKELKVSLLTKTGEVKGDAIEQVLRKSGGKREVLSKVFSGESLKLMTEFGKVYERTFTEVEGNTKEKANAAVEAFRAAVADAGKQTLTAADMQAEAAKRMGDPQAQIRKAMNELQTEFTRPEMLGALREMATVAPKVAHGLTKLVEFAVDNPWTAGGIALGGRAALAGAGSLAGSAGSAMWGGIAEKFTDAVNRKKTVTQSLYDSMGMKIGEKTVEVDVKGGKLANAAKVAGQALGVAAAAVMTYELGKMAIDKFMGDDLANKNAGDNAAAVAEAALGTGDKVQMRAALEKVRAQQKALEGGPGVLESAAGFIANVVTGGEVKTAGEAHQDTQAVLARRATELEEALVRGSESGEKVSRSFVEMSTAARNATAALNKLVPPGGSNGLPRPARRAPGYSGDW